MPMWPSSGERPIKRAQIFSLPLAAAYLLVPLRTTVAMPPSRSRDIQAAAAPDENWVGILRSDVSNRFRHIVLSCGVLP